MEFIARQGKNLAIAVKGVGTQVAAVGTQVAAVGAQAVEHFNALNAQGAKVLASVEETLAITRDIRGVINQFRAGGWVGAAKVFLQNELFVLIATCVTRPFMPHFTETFAIAWLAWRIPARLLSRTAFTFELSLGSIFSNLTISPGALLMSIALCVEMYHIGEQNNPNAFKARFPGHIESAAMYITTMITTQLPMVTGLGNIPGLPGPSIPVCDPGEGCSEGPVLPGGIAHGTAAAELPPMDMEFDTLIEFRAPPITVLNLRTPDGSTSTAAYRDLNETEVNSANAVFDRIRDEDEKLEAAGFKTEAAKNAERVRQSDLRIGEGVTNQIMEFVKDGIANSIKSAPIFWAKLTEFIGAENRNHLIIITTRLMVSHILNQVASGSTGGIRIGAETLLQIKDHAFKLPITYLAPAFMFIFNACACHLVGIRCGEGAPPVPAMGGKRGGQGEKQMQLQIQRPQIKMDTIRESVLLSLHTVGYHVTLHKLWEKFTKGAYKLNPVLESAAEKAILSGMLLDAAFSSKPRYDINFIKEHQTDDISAQILGGNPKSKKKRTYKRGKPSNRKTQLRRRRLLVGKRDAQL
jgi:hypothetical protein